jgi:hypothetical protein
MIEFVAILAFIVACRSLRRAVREPRRIDLHLHIYIRGSPCGPGALEPVFLEEPANPSSNVVPFRHAV